MLFALCTVISFALVGATVNIDIPKVVDYEHVEYLGETYVALITEPVLFRSENQKIIQEVKEDFEKQTLTTTHVVIDFNTYLLIGRINRKLRSGEDCHKEWARLLRRFETENGS